MRWYLPVGAWLALASLVAAVLAVYDKRAAKRGARRIPEKTLLLWGLAGGAAAEWLVMRCIRHKTLHKRFMLGLPAMVLLHAAIGAGLWYFCAGNFT